jgi:histidine triad (HIT) family protein
VPTVFTRIIDGELPARFVYRDDVCVAFLSINPLRAGHTLVVPRAEIDSWLDLPPDLARHAFSVCTLVGQAIADAFRPERVGLMIAGFEVPHVHLHLVPADGMRDLDFKNADPNPDPQMLDDAAERIRAALPPSSV